MRWEVLCTLCMPCVPTAAARGQCSCWQLGDGTAGCVNLALEGSVGKDTMPTVSLWAPWELSALCCWSRSGCSESKGREGFLMGVTWTCSVHVEPCVSMGEEFSAFPIQMLNSLRSDLAHSVKQE